MFLEIRYLQFKSNGKPEPKPIKTAHFRFIKEFKFKLQQKTNLDILASFLIGR